MICPCNGCTKRTAIPNCHAQCDEYMAYARWRECIRINRQIANVGDEARIDHRVKIIKSLYKQRRK